MATEYLLSSKFQILKSEDDNGDNIYEVTVTVRDNPDGNLPSQQAFGVRVINLNELHFLYPETVIIPESSEQERISRGILL